MRERAKYLDALGGEKSGGIEEGEPPPLYTPSLYIIPSLHFLRYRHIGCPLIYEFISVILIHVFWMIC